MTRRLVGWPLDRRAGSMAFHALRAALSVQGVNCTLDSLVTLSGEAFCMVWRRGAHPQELSEVRPVPTLCVAAEFSGFGLEIRTDHGQPHAVDLQELRTAIERCNNPILAPVDDQGKIVVMCSVDDAGCGLAVGADQRLPAQVDLNRGWEGRFPGQEGPKWGNYGVLIGPDELIRNQAADPLALRELFANALALLIEKPRVSSTVGSVQFGLMAAKRAVEDLSRPGALDDPSILTELLVLTEGAEFGFGCCERWMTDHDGVVTKELVRRARSVRAAAGEMAERLWDRNGRMTAMELRQAVMGRKSMVFELPRHVSEAEVPGRVIQASRGRGVIVDTKDRRAALGRLADVFLDALSGFYQTAQADI